MGTEFDGVAAVEGELTGDGRLLENNAVQWSDEEGPWPLRYRPEMDHDGYVVGTITRIWRDGSVIRFEGSLHDDSEDEDVKRYVARVLELADEGLGRISIGFDEERVEIRVKKELIQIQDDEVIG